MSDSDSQNQQNFNLRKLPEEQQPHVKEILQKGKKILPTYDDESLYGLFKRYYSVENIFLNELHIIAKRAKGDNDSDDRKKDQKWIKVGRQIKTKVNKTKYNFLEDKELLRRAEQFIKNKKLAPERKENFTEKEKRDVQKKPQYKKRQYVEQSQKETYNRSAQNQRPKQKFVQKVEDVKKEPQHVTYQEKKVATKKVESPVKEQKYKQKVENTTKVQQKTELKPVQQQTNQAEQKPQTSQHPQHPQHPSKHEEKKHHQPSHHEPQKQQAHKKEEHPKQVQHHAKQVQHPVKQVQHEEKKQHEIHHKKHQQVVSHHEKQPISQTQKESSSHSIPTVPNFDQVVAGENFKQACNQNSFVLNFLQPQPYPQRISYIRTADGGMKNVQIRVTGTTSNQGSQKGL